MGEGVYELSSQMKQLVCKMLVFFLCAGLLTFVEAGSRPARADGVYLNVISPHSTVFTRQSAIDIKVEASEGAAVTIKEGEAVLASEQISATGPVTITVDSLSKGLHQLTAIASIMEGNMEISNVKSLPAIIVDDNDIFDIQDIVGLSGQLKDYPYELQLSGTTPPSGESVLKRNLMFLLNRISIQAAIEMPQLAVTVSPGANMGTTRLQVSPQAGNQLFIKVSSAPQPASALESVVPSDAVPYTSGSDIAGVDTVSNKYVSVYEADLYSRVKKFTQLTLSSGQINPFLVQGFVLSDSGAGVGGIAIKFRSGEDNRTGPVVGETVSDSSGQYSIELSEGAYTAQVNGTGYVTSYLTRSLSYGVNPYNNLIVTAIPQGEEMRVVLTWGTDPKDLDLHLLGPNSDGGYFHLYYGQPTYSVSNVVYAKLDIDQTSGQGPETITTATVLQQVYGKYTFYVHNYSAVYNNGKTLPESSAKVEVFKGESITPFKTYSVPTAASSDPYWHVFDLDIDPSNGLTFNDSNVLMSSEPVYTPTSTSLNSISYNGYGEIYVDLQYNSLPGLTMNDFTVTAEVYNAATGGYSYPTVPILGYNAYDRSLQINTQSLEAGAQPADELNMTIFVAPSGSSVRLTGAQVSTTYTRTPLLVRDDVPAAWTRLLLAYSPRQLGY
jgi:hypothetical protein